MVVSDQAWKTKLFVKGQASEHCEMRRASQRNSNWWGFIFSSMQGCRNLKGAPNYKRLPLDAKCSWPQQGKNPCSNIISWLLTFPFTRIVLAPAIQENKNRIYMGFPWFATWASIWIIWNQSTVCYCQHWPSLQFQTICIALLQKKIDC